MIQNDERLKGGSLVALSSDNFETIVLATISTERKTADAKFKLCFEFETKVSKANKNEAFIIIEAPVYFEAGAQFPVNIFLSFNAILTL